jgi:uridine kinase
MKIDNNENIPFSLFISTQRRRKILQSMWSENERERKEGEKILANYKKQLAEKMAREQMEKTGIPSPKSASRKSALSKTATSFKSLKSSKKEKESEA